MLLYVVGDTAFSSLRVHGGQPVHSVPAAACLIVASLLMTLGAIRQSTVPPQAAPVDEPSPRTGGWPSHLPYLAVTAGNALMLVVTIREGQLFLWGGLVLGQMVMTVFLSLRQIISLRESRALTVTDPLTTSACC
jgi:hypothetical protein